MRIGILSVGAALPWIALVIGAGALGQGSPTPPGADGEALRRHALQVLTTALRGDPIQGMHAAEVLLWNGYAREVRPIYEAGLSSTDPKTRGCVWRVLAQVPELDPAEQESYV